MTFVLMRLLENRRQYDTGDIICRHPNKLHILNKCTYFKRLILIEELHGIVVIFGQCLYIFLEMN